MCWTYEVPYCYEYCFCTKLRYSRHCAIVTYIWKLTHFTLSDLEHKHAVTRPFIKWQNACGCIHKQDIEQSLLQEECMLWLIGFICRYCETSRLEDMMKICKQSKEESLGETVVPQLVKKFPTMHKTPEGSLSFSQIKPATGPYPEPDSLDYKLASSFPRH